MPLDITPDIWFPNIGIYFEKVPKVLFSIPFPFTDYQQPIHLYAICIVIGIVAAYFLGMWWVKKSGQKPDDYNDLLLIGLPLAVVGLRTHYLIFMDSAVTNVPTFFREFFRFTNGGISGLAIYGGIIGAIVAAVIISKRKKIPFATLADTAAPSMLMGQVIGRYGNFFNREAFGGYTNNFLAMRIRADQTGAPVNDEILANIVSHNGVNYFQVHPTFFYESFFNFLLMIALLIYRPRKKFNGEIVLFYFLGYGVIRFFVESLRTDQMMLFNTGLPVNQVIAVLFAFVSAALIIAGHMRAAAKIGRKK
jgi:phosphatidylglycerol:prolipoprotein diacylglycerol transferase